MGRFGPPGGRRMQGPSRQKEREREWRGNAATREKTREGAGQQKKRETEKEKERESGERIVSNEGPEPEHEAPAITDRFRRSQPPASHLSAVQPSGHPPS